MRAVYSAIHTYIYNMIYIYTYLLHYQVYINGCLEIKFLKTILEKLNHLEIKGKSFYLENNIISRWFNDLNVKNKNTCKKKNTQVNHFVSEMPKAETTQNGRVLVNCRQRRSPPISRQVHQY